MSTSKLDKSQPILTFLTPSSTNAAPFSQPAKRPFHDPTTCGMPLVVSNGFRQWFTAPPLVRNMLLIIGFRNEKVNIIEIISFIQTKMLFFCWTRDHDGKHKVIDRPFIVLVSASNMKRQRRAALIDQDMNLGATFASVSGTRSSSFTAQRGRNRFAIDSLPFPANPSLSIVETNHCLQHLVPDALQSPGLESFVQDAAGNTEPITVYRFPLAACPQNVPEAVDDGTIIGTWPSWASPLGWLGQMLLDSTPQRAWDAEIIDILWLCVTLVFVNDTPRRNRFFAKTIFHEVYLFFRLIYFSDRF